MSEPLLKYRQPIAPQDILTEAVPARLYTEGSGLNLARAALFGVPLDKVKDVVELLKSYRGGRPNSIPMGNPLGWGWYATIDTTHHGSLAGPANAHRHSDLANIGIDDHHARDHAARHASGQPDAVSLDASQIGTGQFSLSRLPRAASGQFLEGNGVSADPIYNALVAADIPNLDAAKITTGRFGINLEPSVDATRDLGDASYRWRDLRLSRDALISGSTWASTRIGVGTASVIIPVSTTKWVRIAQSTGVQRVAGAFLIRYEGSGRHGHYFFYAGVDVNVAGSEAINLLSVDGYVPVVPRVRIVRYASASTTYPSYLEIEAENTSIDTLSLYFDQLSRGLEGWNLISPIDGEIPGGYVEVVKTLTDLAFGVGVDSRAFNIERTTGRPRPGTDAGADIGDASFRFRDLRLSRDIYMGGALQSGSVPAARVDSGVLGIARIPDLDTAKITTGIFGVARGGTGLNTIAAGGILYASALDVLSRIAPTAANQVLRSTAANALEIAALVAADIPGLDVAKITTGRFGMARMPDGTSGYRLKAQGAGSDPVYAAITHPELTYLSGSKNIQYSNDVWFELFNSSEVGSSGVYLVCVGPISTYNNGGGLYDESAVFLAGIRVGTNSEDTTNIPCTYGGHATNTRSIAFRLRRSPVADSKSYIDMKVTGESLTSATNIPWKAMKLF